MKDICEKGHTIAVNQGGNYFCTVCAASHPYSTYDTAASGAAVWSKWGVLGFGGGYGIFTPPTIR